MGDGGEKGGVPKRVMVSEDRGYRRVLRIHLHLKAIHSHFSPAASVPSPSSRLIESGTVNPHKPTKPPHSFHPRTPTALLLSPSPTSPLSPPSPNPPHPPPPPPPQSHNPIEPHHPQPDCFPTLHHRLSSNIPSSNEISNRTREHLSRSVERPVYNPSPTPTDRIRVST